MGTHRQDLSVASSAETVDFEVNSPNEDRSLKLREKIYLAVVIILVIASAAGIFAVKYHRGNSFSLLVADEVEQYDLSIINSATVEDFMGVNGIGEVKANAIVNFRESIGGFTDINQITIIDGISDATLEKIIEYFYGEETGSTESEE